MRIFFKIFFAAIGIAIIGVVIYWQYNKKSIVRSAIEKTISKGTDSLYFIHYDSSYIDAVKGDAAFYNLTLQSDSLQKQLADYDTASATSVLNVRISEVSIRGANIPALLRNDKLEARTIHLIRPVIYVINSRKKTKALSKQDTLALYQRMLGKFNRISADEIIIEDGQINFADKLDTAYLALQGLNVRLRNILIDSTKNYDNIISYFINDASVSLKKAVYKNDDNSILMISDLTYDAGKKQISLRNFQQQARDSGAVLFDINNTVVSGVNTDAFILNKQLKAASAATDGGTMTFFTGGNDKSAGAKSETDLIDLKNDFFNEAILNAIELRKTTIRIYNRADPNASPIIINNFRFRADSIQALENGTGIKYLIAKSNWQIAADGFSTVTSNRIYKISLGQFALDKQKAELNISSFSVKPTLSEAAYVKTLKEQTDLYNVTVNKIRLSGIDVRKLVTDGAIIAENAVMEPIIKVYCDRTIAPFTGSKIGNYPHQLIQKLDFPLLVKNVQLQRAYVSYTEKAAQSGKTGVVFFDKAQGTLGNVTNIPAEISKNRNLTLKAQAYFMGVGKITTNWALDLSRTDGYFRISGELSRFNASVLNPLIQPLALASADAGVIDEVSFSMTGNDSGAKGNCTFLYHDLKVEVLKVDDKELKRRGVLSRLANFVVKDANTKGKDTRSSNTDIERDKTRSFFNLVWKGVFKACKRIAIGKDDAGK